MSYSYRCCRAMRAKSSRYVVMPSMFGGAGSSPVSLCREGSGSGSAAVKRARETASLPAGSRSCTAANQSSRRLSTASRDRPTAGIRTDAAHSSARAPRAPRPNRSQYSPSWPTNPGPASPSSTVCVENCWQFPVPKPPKASHVTGEDDLRTAIPQQAPATSESSGYQVSVSEAARSSRDACLCAQRLCPAPHVDSRPA